MYEYRFPTVAQVIAQLQKCPQDAEVHIGHWQGFLDDDFKQVSQITERQTYDLFPAESVEHKVVYEWSIREGRYKPVTCVVISSD